MSRTRQKLFFLLSLHALLLSFVPVVSGVGNFKYCCNIQKCNNITAVCRTNPDCRSACATDLVCDPPEQLAVKDYSCFRNHLNDTQNTALGIICNQTYNPLQSPAPSFQIDYATYNRDCSGWPLADPNKPNSWAAPILQYLLPVVIFSMTIPRRQKWEVKGWWFDFELNHVEGILRAIVSLFWAGIVVTADTTVWVFVIFVLAGPMLVGGIHEAVLDYTVLQHLDGSEHVRTPVYDEAGELIREDSDFRHLSEEEKVELMLAILSGNLDRTVGKPQNILRGVIGLPQAAPDEPTDRRPGVLNGIAQQPGIFPPSPIAQGPAGQEGGVEVAPFQRRRTRLDVVEMQLQHMLQSQNSFGSIVGAPVLFYIGAFVYTLVGLSANKGDNDTAHSLAFGMWWMGIVHVAIVSGCLLASNNPSTLTAIVATELVRRQTARRGSFERRTRDRTYLLMSPVYHSQFMPVPLWDRGRMKKMWVESTDAFRGQEWFRRRISIRIGWILIPLTAFSLIFVPSALAFAVSYTTPRICLSCRSLTFLLYVSCQIILIIATTFHTWYSTTSSTDAILSFLHFPHLFWRIVLGLSLFVAICAMGVSLFTSSAGTFMHIIGTYHNCLCSIPATSWLTTRDSEMINLPTDTAEDRDASKYWATCGYVAIGFMALVCYVGWWYQRYLRRRFMQRVDSLAPRHQAVEMRGAVLTRVNGAGNENRATPGMRSTLAGRRRQGAE